MMVLPSRETINAFNSAGGDSKGANAVGDVTTNEFSFAETSTFKQMFSRPANLLFSCLSH